MQALVAMRPMRELTPLKAQRCRSLGPFTKKGAFAAAPPDPVSGVDPRGGVDTNALTSAAIVPESTMRFTHPRRTDPSGSPPQLCRGDLAFETPREASHGSLR